jgi:hypothetical protein
MFQAYTESEPDNAWGRYMLGLSAWKTGDHTRALEAFDAALRLDPSHRKSLLNSARPAEMAGHRCRPVIVCVASSPPSEVSGWPVAHITAAWGDAAIGAYQARDDIATLGDEQPGYTHQQAGRFRLPPLARRGSGRNRPVPEQPAIPERQVTSLWPQGVRGRSRRTAPTPRPPVSSSGEGQRCARTGSVWYAAYHQKFRAQRGPWRTRTVTADRPERLAHYRPDGTRPGMAVCPRESGMRMQPFGCQRSLPRLERPARSGSRCQPGVPTSGATVAHEARQQLTERGRCITP